MGASHPLEGATKGRSRGPVWRIHLLGHHYVRVGNVGYTQEPCPGVNRGKKGNKTGTSLKGEQVTGVE